MKEKIKTIGIGLIVIMQLVGLAWRSSVPFIAHAATPSVIINELNYNPLSDVDNDEFLELYNTTAAPVDLTGWCFTAGITLCFNSGTTIAANGYGVVSRDAAQTQTTYGITTIGTYTGKLDNGGETITLTDNNATVVNSITYDDVSPWPATPDGSGPSLELKKPTLDNTLPDSWSASQTNNGTPGAENSHVNSNPPTITDVTHPDDVTATTTPTITARITNATAVNLVYKVMFNTDQTLTMYDDGAHFDGSANDGVYGAMIPAQAAGQLVRYKVSASNAGDTIASPGNDDTINYQGYTIQNPITTQLPVFQWFMDPTQQADMIANHSHDDQVFDCVVAYDNTVIDNAKVHIKGITTRNLPKKAFAIDLPKGHLLQLANMTRAVDEFHLNSTYLDPSGVADVLAWRLAEQMGMPTTQMFKIRLQSNGDFYGLYTFAEEYDGQWRELNHYDTGSFYKDTVKKTRLDIDDGNEYAAWYNDTNVNKSPERRTYIMDNQDIPNMINTMVFEVFVRNGDWLIGRNQFSYHDLTDTGRWSTLPYDLDGASFGGSADTPGQNFMTPYEFPNASGRFTRIWRSPYLAIYDEPDLREVYYRRLRTIADEYLTTGWYSQQYEQLKQITEPEFKLDYQKWGALADPEFSRSRIANVIAETKFNILNRFHKPWAVPDKQSTSAVIDTDEVSYSMVNQNDSYIKLKNNSSETVDMTGWKIPEVGFTFPLAAGLAPGQIAYIPRKDSVFKTSHSGSYVLGQLKQDIPQFGTLTIQRKDGSLASTKTY